MTKTQCGSSLTSPRNKTDHRVGSSVGDDIVRGLQQVEKKRSEVSIFSRAIGHRSVFETS